MQASTSIDSTRADPFTRIEATLNLPYDANNEALRSMALQEYYLHGLRGGRTTPERSIDDLMLGTCDLLLEMLRGKAPEKVISVETSVPAFGIACLIFKLHQKRFLIREEIDLAEIIFSSEGHEIEGNAPIRSRFYFLEYLRRAGFIRPDVIDRGMKPITSTPTARDVLKLVEHYRGVTMDQIKSSNRSRNVVDARFRAIYILRKVCLMSLNQIGHALGDRDHTTILNGLIQQRNKMSIDAGVRRAMLRMCNTADAIGVYRHADFLQAKRGGKTRMNLPHQSRRLEGVSASRRMA